MLQKLQEYKGLILNVSWLGIIQVLNMVFPLLYLPYATRIIGPAYFGEVEYALNIVVYFTYIINYGFYYSATREISISRENKRKVNRIVSRTLCAKMALGLLVGAVYLLMVFLKPAFINNQLIYLVAFLSLVGVTITPWFLLQGLEKFKLVGVFTLVMRVLSLVLVFVFLKDEEDYYWLVILNSGPELIIGIASVWLLKRLKISVDFRQFKMVPLVLKRNFFVFANEYVILLLVNSIVLFSGFYLSKDHVGNYTAAYKVVGLVQVIFLATFIKASFPYFSKLYAENASVYFQKFKRIQRFFLATVFMVCLFVWLFAQEIVLIIFGDKFQEAGFLLEIFAFLPFFMAISAYYGWVGLIVLGNSKTLFRITLTFGILTVVSLIIFGQNFGMKAFAATRLICEAAMSLVLLCYYLKFSAGIRRRNEKPEAL